MDVYQAAIAARNASHTLAALNVDVRNSAINAMKDALLKNKEAIFTANQADLIKAKEEALCAPLLKRLAFDETKLQEVISGIDSLIALPDPLNQTTLARELAEGLDLYRVTCPIGVIGVVFESRPDALVQIATLALKSGNAVLLKGGREALNTNRALYDALMAGSDTAGIHSAWAALLETREDVGEMLKADEYIDLLIPRGSNEFVRYMMENTNIPVMGHAKGLCHTYVDAQANIDMAVKVIVDAKTQSYAVCNATETLLVHRDILPDLLPKLYDALNQKRVEIRGDEAVYALIPCEKATQEDWETEYLAPILSIKTIDSLDEAIAHINRYGSHHTDAIITDNAQNAKSFTVRIDSAGVYVNCSTRFADGFRYGFGAEVGVATGKLHARGPVGLEGLCTYKYLLLGSGQTVKETMDATVRYTHQPLKNNCPL